MTPGECRDRMKFLTLHKHTRETLDLMGRIVAAYERYAETHPVSGQILSKRPELIREHIEKLLEEKVRILSSGKPERTAGWVADRIDKIVYHAVEVLRAFKDDICGITGRQSTVAESGSKEQGREV